MAAVAFAGFEGVAHEKPRAGTECRIDRATLTASGCREIASDTAARKNPKRGLWGRIDCETPERVRRQTAGGDSARTALGDPQGNGAYRLLRVKDDDDFYGERCELGRNDSRFDENSGRSKRGTFALYREGERRLTFFSQRYGAGFQRDARSWQTVMQMKQTQPSENGDGSPVIELQIRGGRLLLVSEGRVRWSAPAPRKQRWIRYALDVSYSREAEAGQVRVFADLDSDGDALGRREASGWIGMPTLKSEPDSGGLLTPRRRGEPIPSHLRVGIYHDPVLPCRPPRGCNIGIDNVQVLEPRKRG